MNVAEYWARQSDFAGYTHAQLLVEQDCASPVPAAAKRLQRQWNARSQWKEITMRKSTRSNEVRRRVSAPVHVDEVEESACDTMVLSPDDSVVLSPDDSVLLHPHRLEQEVRNRLMSEPSLNFTSLVVRRVRDALCLNGVLEVDDEVDVGLLVRSVCGATPVLNHLVVHSTRELPPKG